MNSSPESPETTDEEAIYDFNVPRAMLPKETGIDHIKDLQKKGWLLVETHELDLNFYQKTISNFVAKYGIHEIRVSPLEALKNGKKTTVVCLFKKAGASDSKK
jgi:hypothetical protein